MSKRSKSKRGDIKQLRKLKEEWQIIVQHDIENGDIVSLHKHYAELEKVDKKIKKLERER